MDTAHPACHNPPSCSPHLYTSPLDSAMMSSAMRYCRRSATTACGAASDSTRNTLVPSPPARAASLVTSGESW